MRSRSSICRWRLDMDLLSRRRWQTAHKDQAVNGPTEQKSNARRHETPAMPELLDRDNVEGGKECNARQRQPDCHIMPPGKTGQKAHQHQHEAGIENRRFQSQFQVLEVGATQPDQDYIEPTEDNDGPPPARSHWRLDQAKLPAMVA